VSSVFFVRAIASAASCAASLVVIASSDGSPLAPGLIGAAIAWRTQGQWYGQHAGAGGNGSTHASE
jgi:hypothetical protein